MFSAVIHQEMQKTPYMLMQALAGKNSDCSPVLPAVRLVILKSESVTGRDLKDSAPGHIISNLSMEPPETLS